MLNRIRIRITCRARARALHAMHAPWLSLEFSDFPTGVYTVYISYISARFLRTNFEPPPPLTESLMVRTAGLVLATTAQPTMLPARLRAAMAFPRASVSAPEVWSGAPPAHRVDPEIALRGPVSFAKPSAPQPQCSLRSSVGWRARPPARSRSLGM